MKDLSGVQNDGHYSTDRSFSSMTLDEAMSLNLTPLSVTWRLMCNFISTWFFGPVCRNMAPTKSTLEIFLQKNRNLDVRLSGVTVVTYVTSSWGSGVHCHDDPMPELERQGGRAMGQVYTHPTFLAAGLEKPRGLKWKQKELIGTHGLYGVCEFVCVCRREGGGGVGEIEHISNNVLPLLVLVIIKAWYDVSLKANTPHTLKPRDA